MWLLVWVLNIQTIISKWWAIGYKMWSVPSIIKIIDHLPITAILSKYLAVNWERKKECAIFLENWHGFGDTVNADYILDRDSYVSKSVYQTSSLLSVMCGLLLSVLCGLLLSVMCELLLSVMRGLLLSVMCELLLSVMCWL